MSEPIDKALHDWVRQSLETYRPDYDPNNWAKLRRNLRRRRWQRWGFLLGSLFLIGFVGWLVIRPATDDPKIRSSVSMTHPKKQSQLVPNRVIDEHLTNLAPTHNSNSVAFRSVSRLTRQVAEPAVVEIPAILPFVSMKLMPTQLSEEIYNRQPIAFSREETEITQQMLTGDFGSDSTSYRVLNRNLRAWPDAVIVCDFTTSMYPYSTQLFAWFKQHAQHPSIKGMVFFTDCDSLGHQTQPGGPAGQMFVTRENDPTKILPTLLAATRNTVRNYDDAENDVEALLFAQKQFPEANHLILLADNISRVKDMTLVDKLSKPVHIILCGTTGSDTTHAYQPDFQVIANRTNGSLHTLEDDLIPTALSSTTTLRVGSRYFRYLPRQRRFKPTSFDHRPKRILKFIWF